MLVRLRDIQAAEEALDAAEEALRGYRDPAQWAAHESLDRDGRRTLHLSEAYFSREQRLEADVHAARERLAALQRAFGAGRGA